MTYEETYGKISGFCPKCGTAMNLTPHARCPLCDPPTPPKEEMQDEREEHDYDEAPRRRRKKVRRSDEE